MANREYEMLFKLGAQLGQNFRGTFSSAQQVLTATQKKLQELNKLQSDVNAYQRQQSGIEKSTQKLEMYKSQLANTQRALDVVRKEIERNGSASGELAAKESELVNKELALRNRIRDTENAISDKNKALNSMGQRLSEAGVNTERLDTEIVRINGDITRLTEQQNRAADEANKFGNNAAGALDAVGSALVASGIAAGLKKIYEGFANCVGASAEFEATMSTVEALSGASASEMFSLSEEAKRLGATTAFTATQSAQAMTYMGMAGWEASEMLSGMNGVMALAAASGEDLGLVSDIVTDNLTAFGLKAKDTAHFSDVLAAAATNSNTSVAIMGETFSGSAAIAGALGYSIEDVAVAVGAMANAGVKGSVAGTALKNTFNGLLEGATLTGQAFGEVEYTAVNADGTMKSFSQTINELRVYFDQMTESERVNNAMALAGQRGYNGLLAILNTSEQEYQKLTDSINSCTGAAQRMADIKLDNLAGDVTLLRSAADGLKMSVGELYRDELRNLAQMGTEILGSVQEFIKENPAVVKGIFTMVGGIGALVAGYKIFNAIKKAHNTYEALSIALKIKNTAATAGETAAEGANATATTGSAAAHKALNLAMLANPAVIITASIIALTARLVALREACKTTALEEQNLNTATFAQNNEVERLNQQYTEACERYGETSDKARALKYDLDNATAAVEAQSFSVSALYSEIDALHSSTGDLLSVFNDAAAGIDEERESAQILTAKLKEISASSDTAADKQAKIEPIIKRLNELYPSLGLTVDNVADKMDGLSTSIDKAAGTESLQAKYNAANQSLKELYIQQEKLKTAYEKAQVVQQAAQKKYLAAFGDGSNYLEFTYKTNLAVIKGQAKDVIDELDKSSEEAQTVRDDLLDVERQIAQCNAAISEYNQVVLGTSEETVSAYNAISIATSDVKELTENLVKAYNDAYAAAYSSVSGQYALWDEAASVVPTSIGTINSAISSQIEYWDKYNANLELLTKRSENIEGLADVIAGFADGSKDSVAAIAGMANASDADLKKMVDNFSKLKAEQEKTSESLADIKTDFAERMDEITEIMSQTVSNMNMDSEAAKAAKDTIQAYADGIMSKKTQAVEAAIAVAEATSAALAKAPMSTASATAAPPATSSAPATTGSGFNPNISMYNKSQTYGPVMFDPNNAYADGTDYASAGYALVGEEGPEIVYMRGGEKVVDAVHTRSIMGGQNNTITISPQFVIHNNGGGDMGEEQISSLSERLKEDILDALEQAGIDRRRSVYA